MNSGTIFSRFFLKHFQNSKKSQRHLGAYEPRSQSGFPVRNTSMFIPYSSKGLLKNTALEHNSELPQIFVCANSKYDFLWYMPQTDIAACVNCYVYSVYCELLLDATRFFPIREMQLYLLSLPIFFNEGDATM